LGAIFFAAAQLLEAKKYTDIIAQQAQATLLLNLIDKWNSDKMHQGRATFDEVEATAKGIIFPQHVGLSEKECTKKLQEHFRVTLAGIDNTDSKKYTSMLEVLSFFELVGELVKRRYVLLTDIDGLFRGPILDFGVAYVLHIKDEQQKRDVPPGYYENALFLISEIKKICPQ
jgi:hypothetical protein